MGHESQIELWSPHGRPFCFAGFGTDRLRREQAMKTAGRENPNRWTIVPSNRAHGAEGQNNSRSIIWAEKQQNFQLMEMCFFLTSPFIELIRHYFRVARHSRANSETRTHIRSCRKGCDIPFGDSCLIGRIFSWTTDLRVVSLSSLWVWGPRPEISGQAELFPCSRFF
jgi:hypothetical protein